MTIYLIVIFFFNFHPKCSNLLFKDEMDEFFLMFLKMVIRSFE